MCIAILYFEKAACFSFHKTGDFLKEILIHTEGKLSFAPFAIQNKEAATSEKIQKFRTRSIDKTRFETTTGQDKKKTIRNWHKKIMR